MTGSACAGGTGLPRFSRLGVANSILPTVPTLSIAFSFSVGDETASLVRAFLAGGSLAYWPGCEGLAFSFSGGVAAVFRWEWMLALLVSASS